MKVSIILPYFGTLPDYFDKWLESASKNDTFNFLLFLDQEISYEIPNNVSVVYCSFESIQNLIRQKLGRFCKIGTPYKLCDYRLAFGVIFSEYLTDSDWWGYCDPDVVWGDLASFLTPDLFDSYDRILTLGHLSLFKNTPKNNNAYKAKTDMNYSAFEAFHLNYNVALDELGGKNLSDRGIYKTYDSRENILDIWPTKFKFRTLITRKNENYFIAEYDNGHVYGHFVAGDEIVKREFLYIHLQKRKMQNEVTDNRNYLIVPNKFVSVSSEMLLPENIIRVNNEEEYNYNPEKPPRRFKLNIRKWPINCLRTFRKFFYKISHLTKK